MSLQTEIQTRKEILKTRLANINESLVDKGVNPVRNFAEVPAAIDAIRTGGIDDDIDDTFINDGNTHIWIRLEEGHTSPCLGLCVSSSVMINWGDGSETEVLVGIDEQTPIYTQPHHYPSAGDYKITIVSPVRIRFYGLEGYVSKVLSEENKFNCASEVYPYRNTIRKLELGEKVWRLESGAFAHCENLAYVSMTDNITVILHRAFMGCSSLKYIKFPSKISVFGGFTIQDCFSLERADFSPNYAYLTSNICENCKSLKEVVIPEGIKGINSGAFRNCISLETVTLPSTIQSLSQDAFKECRSLQHINLLNTITSLENGAFSGCRLLKNINIPNGIIELKSDVFRYCYSFENIYIPSSITYIGQNVFAHCCNMKYYDFTDHTTVPSLSATNAFYDIPSDCEIRVPMALVDEWKAATNWSTFADYIVGV